MNDSPIPMPSRPAVNSSGSKALSRPASGFQRTASALRTVLPHLLRLLPLLDGNVGSAVSSLLAPPPPPPPAEPVDLEPIEKELAALNAGNGRLQAQLLEQDQHLTGLQGRLETIEESATQAVLWQQELLEELKRVENRVEELSAAGKRARGLSIIGLGAIGLLIALNVALLLHSLHILP